MCGGKTMSLAVAAVALSAGLAQAAPVIDGSISPGEWASTPALTPLATATGIEVLVQSDVDNLYILGNTADDDIGDPLDVFDVNIGLHGNAAAWRYRVIAKNNGAPDVGAGTTEAIQGDWFGNLQGGDDSSVANATFGVPAGLTDIGIAGGGVQWVVGLDVTNGNRVHEIAIPWDTLLDGQNGWDRSAAVPLAFAGSSQIDGEFNAFPTGLDFGDQSTYAKVELNAVPIPGALPLMATGLAGIA